MTIPAHLLNQITTGDARVLCEEIPDESVDLIFTDPPYPREYLPLYGWLAETAARVLKPGGSLITLAGHIYLDQVFELLRGKGIDYHWTCALYQATVNNSYRCFSRRVDVYWKPMLWFTRGTYTGPILADGINNTVADKAYHRWGQAPKWAASILERLPHDWLIFDPFTGGGTVPAVCKMLGRNYIAMEIDPDTAQRARARIEQTQAMHPVLLGVQEAMELAV